jgi:cyclopropane fatty-acyl-phospholipid synthase-like methyltransferase
MSFFRRLSFILWYVRRAPWDTGIVPPEVEAFIHSHPPGRALDLGCGTGTSSIALARAGWTVTGVDFVPRAIKRAIQASKIAGVRVDFHLDDVTRLPGITAPFELVLDIGCFHGLAKQQKDKYLANLAALLAPRGSWLLYGFFKPDEAPGPGLTAAEPEELARRFQLLWRQDGVDKKDRPSAWFCFQVP